ncbi:MAG: hypothetical protein JWO81_1216, partial [Alphaproteobacteria bacterium]|nr:hypothetical protein [Alphaproteobacteria bacterium]
MARATETVRQESEAALLLARARRITVKIGSSLLIDAGTGGARREWLGTLAA